MMVCLSPLLALLDKGHDAAIRLGGMWDFKFPFKGVEKLRRCSLKQSSRIFIIPL